MSYDLARKRVVVYIHEALHQPYRHLRNALPETLCKIIGFAPVTNAEAVRTIIAFSHSRVVADLYARRRKLKRALRANRRGLQPAEEFYASLTWKKLRYKVLQKSGGKCQCCGTLGADSPLHVDHIKPRSKYPDLALEESNLQVLCADCNVGKLNVDETDWRDRAANEPLPVIQVVK